ncbi:hypothetical protein JOL79_01460 [Microbispora sp. RL4-1S]|uniref:Peptidase n=1 Tax=Microbispora oryzae TaxID=2806554 RepID=A0A940WJ23_9ACTN|nr:hypothetical protein [Microbispora oryzae]MBP2702465.1 hypothetical protein [Microbispora oryzae]
MRPGGRRRSGTGARAAVRVAVAAVLLAAPTAAAPADRLLASARAVVRQHPGMWGQAPLARGRNVIVVGGSRALAADLARLADGASRTIARVWGRPVDAVILVPATDDQAAELAAPAPVEGFAAFAAADHVIVAPSGFARLSETGRRVVVTHELTHLATGAAVRPGMPPWLVEGFADYVGYLGSGLPVPVIAAELGALVRGSAPGGSAFPGELPGRADFAAHPAEAYEAAWLACRHIAERYGEHALVALYRAALREGITAALRSTLALTPAALTDEWRRYVREEVPVPPG